MATIGDQNKSPGFVLLPLALLIVVALLFVAGFFGIYNSWLKSVDLQYRLDKCVANRSLSLEKHLNRIEKMNKAIFALRAAILASVLLPETTSALQSSLRATVLLQDSIIAKWKLESAAWALKRGCDNKNDLPLPLPQMPWIRDPPDLIGFQALYWPADREKSLKIRILHPPRSAAALIKFDNDWSSQWIP